MVKYYLIQSSDNIVNTFIEIGSQTSTTFSVPSTEVGRNLNISYFEGLESNPVAITVSDEPEPDPTDYAFQITYQALDVGTPFYLVNSDENVRGYLYVNDVYQGPITPETTRQEGCVVRFKVTGDTIADKWFNDNTTTAEAIRELKLLNNKIKTIGENAFYMTNLQAIDLSGATTIQAHAFEGCYQLATVNGMASLISIGDYTFGSCSNIISMELGESLNLQTIGTYCFSYCDKLQTITLPAGELGITSLGEWAFYGCSQLTSFNTGNQLSSLTWNAFAGCDSLTAVTLGSQIDTVYDFVNHVNASLSQIHLHSRMDSRIVESAYPTTWSLQYVRNLDNTYLYAHGDEIYDYYNLRLTTDAYRGKLIKFGMS